jgi:hypothetical protein
VIGPQQQFLKDIQSRMWREGELFRQQQQAARQVSPRTVPALGLRSNPTSPVGDSILPNLKETSPRSARSSGKSNSDVPRSNSSAKLHIDLTRTGSSSSLKVKQPTSARSNKNNGECSYLHLSFLVVKQSVLRAIYSECHTFTPSSSLA